MAKSKKRKLFKIDRKNLPLKINYIILPFQGDYPKPGLRIKGIVT